MRQKMLVTNTTNLVGILGLRFFARASITLSDRAPNVAKVALIIFCFDKNNISRTFHIQKNKKIINENPTTFNL